jgi:hypothetical protein
MKLRSLVLALAFALVSVDAHAQSGVFVTMDAQQFTQQGIFGSTSVGTHSNIDRPWVFGPTYGGYFTVTHVPLVNQLPYMNRVKTGPVTIAIDARGDTYRVSEYGSTLNRQDGLFSLRVAPRQQFYGSTPYVVGGFGIGHTKIPHATYYNNNLIYQVGIGADRRIAKNIDWRVFEATIGTLRNFPDGGIVLPNQSNYLVTVRTGLVFRSSPPAAKSAKK